jgi:hypothetical protein
MIDHPFDLFFTSVTVILFGLFFVVLPISLLVWPITAWICRRNRRKALHDLLGDGFRENHSYIRCLASISVDEKSQRFAVIDSKRKVLCKAEEIIGLEFTPGTLAGEEAKYSKAKKVLAIETINENLPRIQITPSMFGEAQLGEIYVRLKKIQAGNKVIAEATK